MSSSWNFKNNLTIDNSRFLNWLDTSGAQNNIIGLDVNSNVNLNTANGKGDLYINSNTTTGSTFINFNNSQSVLIASNLGVGINNTSNMNANVVLPADSWIGLNTTPGASDGYLALAASSLFDNSDGSIMFLYGNETAVSGGQLNLCAGNVTTGSINFFTGNGSNRMQIQPSGTITMTPDGSSSYIVSIDPDTATFTNSIAILNSTSSISETTGALTVQGGVGIVGDVNIHGTLSINSVTGNLNFNKTDVSTSYTSGAITIDGGLGISCSQAATSVTSGGGISVAGGLAVGQNAMISGPVKIFSTCNSVSSFTGALVAYGGAGINGQTNIRTNIAPQIRLAGVNAGNETSIMFSATNNYTTAGSWTIGQNTNSVGTGNLGIVNAGTTVMMFDGNFVNVYQDTNFNSITAANINFTGELFQNGTPYVGSQWSGSSGSTIYFGSSGSVHVGIGTTNPGYTLDINGDINISGNINAGGAILYSNSAQTLAYLTLTATDGSVSASSGALVSFGGVSIQSSINATSPTAGGGLTVLGGAGIGQDLYVNGNINFNGGLYQNGVPYIGSQWSGSSGSTLYYGSSGSVHVGIGTTNPSQMLDVNGNINFNGGLYQNGVPYIGSQWSGSSGNIIFFGSSGSVNVGIGTTNPQYTLDINGTLRTTNFIANVTTSSVFTNTLGISGITSYYSGTFAGANNVLSPADVTGVSFPVSSVRSCSISIAVSISCSTGGNLFAMYSIDAIQNDLGWQVFPSCVGDNTGVVFSITPVGQLQYTSTNVSNWLSTTMNYSIQAISTSSGYTPVIPTTANFNISGILSTFNTTDSTNSSTGALIVAGGAGIAKNINVGGGLSLGGISNYYSGTFTGANNVVTPANITGVAFSSSVTRSFNLDLSIAVFRSVGGNSFAQYTIGGMYNDLGWQIDPHYIGDNTGITFSITSGGQLQYTSTNLSNWLSTTMNYNIRTISTAIGYAPNIPTSGNLNVTGTMVLSNSSDSTTSSSGALTVSGGIGIIKNANVGGNLTINGAFSVAGNKVFGGTFNAANGTTVNGVVTNLIFDSGTYRSFNLIVSVSVVAGVNCYAHYTISGIQSRSGWSIYTDIIGDSIDINFSIDSSTGQIYYSSSTTYSGWVSTVLNYHATGMHV